MQITTAFARAIGLVLGDKKVAADFEKEIKKDARPAPRVERESVVPEELVKPVRGVDPYFEKADLAVQKILQKKVKKTEAR